MVGTGVFTSLGYQLLAVQDTVSIVLLWLIGGFMALFGAFSYGQLGTHFRESGGDYIFLSRIFHPVLGYLSSWVSLLVGFSAPVAIAAIAMMQYLFIGFSLWILGYTLYDKPVESLIGLGIIGVGIVTYFLNRFKSVYNTTHGE